MSYRNLRAVFFSVALLVPSIGISASANGQSPSTEQIAHTAKLNQVLSPNRYVGIVTFASKMLKGFKFRDGGPTTEPVCMPLTRWEGGAISGYGLNTFRVDGSFGRVLEISGELPIIENLDIEKTYSNEPGDLRYELGLEDLIRSCWYDDAKRIDYFIVVGDPSQPLQSATFIGPISKENVPDIAWAVLFVHDYLGGKVTDADSPRLLQGPGIWLKAMGQAIVDEQDDLKRRQHPAATADK